MSTPAERYAASRTRSRYTATESFRRGYEFELDAYQIEACHALEDGKGVLVAAPTGAGKTVVAHFGVALARRQGRRVMYTTPIKALSNQKYAELRCIHPDVGLLTGDVSINGSAPVVVMTTEVLRNMLYNAPDELRDVGLVVMDEVHYLADRFRGPVWEEVLIHLPESVQVVSLSATVSNAEEFGAWLSLVRGDTEVIVSEIRPVPLTQHVMVAGRLFDLYDPSGALNPELLAEARVPRRGRRVPRGFTVAELDRDALLPAIYFIFSRAGCEGAFDELVDSSLALTSPEESRRIRAIVEHRTAGVEPADLGTLRYDRWLRGLTKGVAAHHAGMIPLFKEIVEELFTEGLLKIVFATETLSLGINMPARSVVLERLDKWDGSAHERLTPGEYTQLTGRAGRRGIDIEGHAVVLHSRDVHVEALAGLASKRTYPLRSAFKATYNMSVNLLARSDRPRAHEVLQSSFAQYQADRSVVALARQVRSIQNSLGKLEREVTCERGDIHEYLELRSAISRREREHSAEMSRAALKVRADVADAARVGDVIPLGSGRRGGHAVVVGAFDHARVGRILDVVTDSARARRVTADDLPSDAAILGRIKTGNARSPKGRSDAAARIREFVGGRMKQAPRRRARRETSDPALDTLKARLRSHPCHRCPDIGAHAAMGRRWQRAKADEVRLLERIETSTGTIAAGFDRLVSFLDSLGYLEDDSPTRWGTILRKIYNECDLLTAECLRRGIWDDLTAPELAGAVSVVVTEARGEPARVNTSKNLRIAVAATHGLWGQLSDGERQHGIDSMRHIDSTLAGALYAWASGAPLAQFMGELLPGDFVRAGRQVIDVLDQLASIDELSDALRQRARQARAAVDRGIVALVAD